MRLWVVVEGRSDEGAARALLRFTGHEVHRILTKNGKAALDRDLPKYHRAARRDTWLVLRDSDGRCPVELVADLTKRVGVPSPDLHLRIAHSMTEAWLLADRVGFATYFRVPESRIPMDPEAAPRAKDTVLNLCASSRSRDIRRRMTTGRSGETGPDYVATLNDYATTSWNVAAAAEQSPSLRRAVERLRAMG